MQRRGTKPNPAVPVAGNPNGDHGSLASASSGANPPDALAEARFWEVTRQWQHGELTRSEAAYLLGMDRWDYDARLRELRISQIPEERTLAELNQAVEWIRELREQNSRQKGE